MQIQVVPRVITAGRRCFRMAGGVLHIAEAGSGFETERDEGMSQIVRVQAASLVGVADEPASGATGRERLDPPGHRPTS